MAEAALLAEWGRCRWLWNEAVHQQKSGQKPTFAKLCKMLTKARAKMLWLREGSQVAQQQTLRDYSRALDQSFKVKGRGRPVMKARKKALPTLEYTTRGFGISNGRLTLPKGVAIPVVWSRELPSLATSVRVYQDNVGHWYASFVVRREIVAYPRGEGGIGIDWGVSNTATTTDSVFDLPHLGHRKRCAAELAKAQRKMARRYRKGRPNSCGYAEAKQQAARLAKKAARGRGLQTCVPGQVHHGQEGRRRRDRRGQTRADRTRHAGRAEGGDRPARLHDHDVQPVLCENQAARTARENFPMRLRPCRRSRSERCQSDSGCGRTGPHQC
jgi:transposase